MITPHVHDFCQKVWDARQGSCLPGGMELCRGMFQAVAADVAEHAGYDPGADLRVEWLGLVAQKRSAYRPEVKPMAPEPMEDTVAWLLGRERPERQVSGIERSAGEVEA